MIPQISLYPALPREGSSESEPTPQPISSPRADNIPECHGCGYAFNLSYFDEIEYAGAGDPRPRMSMKKYFYHNNVESEKTVILTCNKLVGKVIVLFHFFLQF